MIPSQTARVFLQDVGELIVEENPMEDFWGEVCILKKYLLLLDVIFPPHSLAKNPPHDLQMTAKKWESAEVNTVSVGCAAERFLLISCTLALPPNMANCFPKLIQKNYLKYQGMSVSCETMTCIQLHNHYGSWTEWSAVWSVMGVLKIKQVFSKSLISNHRHQ